jgi:hypothetical protein
MRVLGLSLAGLLLSVITAAQDKPVTVCLVTAEAPRGNAIVYSADPLPERELLFNKLNTNNAKVSLRTHNADPGEGMSCSGQTASSSCQYIVAVTPISASSYKYVVPLPTQSSESYKASQPDEATKFVQEHQQEPLDHANVRYQVFENGSCRLVAAKELSKLQTVSGHPTKDSIDWLTSKVVEGVSAAIAKDAKKPRP